MALTESTKRRPGRIWSRLHYMIRFLGLTGLLALGSGLVLAHLQGILSLNLVPRLLRPDTVTSWLLFVGLAAVVPALLVEMVLMVSLTAGRRNLVGFNALIQIVLAVALLVGVNVWSAGLDLSIFGMNLSVPKHYASVDLTRDQTFTLPEDVQKQFQSLKGETTVVIYLRHRTLGGVSDLPDQYDVAAERKVIEKLKDLVEQLRELGSRFNVQYLDTEAEGYQDQFRQLNRHLPKDLSENTVNVYTTMALQNQPLLALGCSSYFMTKTKLQMAIEKASENSIFFCDSDKTDGSGAVQQLSFNDFLRLDKTDSREASKGRGNLVLIRNGVEPIADHIVNLEQRRPRVGVLVIHEALTTEGALDFYTLAGVRKTLTEQGFDVRDLVLKRESESAGFEPTVDPLEDSKLDRLRNEREEIRLDLEELDERIKLCTELLGLLPNGSLAEVNKRLRFFGLVLPSDKGRPEVRRAVDERLAVDQQQQRERIQQADEIDREIKTLNIDQIQDRRRMTDLQAKMERQLDECDLLFIPRITTDNEGNVVVPPQLHDLDRRQVDAIKKYLRGGKPLLVSFGSLNRISGPPVPPDPLETLLGELGLRFGKRTVLLEVEKQTFLGEPPSPFRKRPLRIPDLELGGSIESQLAQRHEASLQKQTLSPRDLLLAGAWFNGQVNGPLAVLPALVPQKTLPSRLINPLRESLNWTARSAAVPLSLKVRKPRPVDVDPEVAARLTYEPVFLVTSAASWNDDNPFPSRGRQVPRFQHPTGFDPDQGTIDEKRQGPFPIAVAYEAVIPSSWQTSESDPAKQARLVAIGQGGIFVGTELSPAQQRLLLDSCNWLLGREDRLARHGATWSYPRVDLDDYQQAVWLWACRLGLPVLFLYFGLVVLLARRVR